MQNEFSEKKKDALDRQMERLEPKIMEAKHVVIRPRDNKCEKLSLPKTKEEFVETAKTLGIEWELDEVINVEEAGE